MVLLKGNGSATAILVVKRKCHNKDVATLMRWTTPGVSHMERPGKLVGKCALSLHLKGTSTTIKESL